MEALLQSVVVGSHGWVAYGFIFSILVACGLGVPLPEDVWLILGGFLAHQGAVRLPAMIFVGFLGILAGDSCIYFAGRGIGGKTNAENSWIGRMVTPQKRVKVESLFTRHGQRIVMAARFLPGVRAVTYFTAGSARMGYGRFIVFDALAAMASAPLFVYLGYHFGGQIEWVVRKAKQGEAAVIVGLILVASAYYLIHRRAKAAEKKELLSLSVEPDGVPPQS